MGEHQMASTDPAGDSAGLPGSEMVGIVALSGRALITRFAQEEVRIRGHPHPIASRPRIGAVGEDLAVGFPPRRNGWNRVIGRGEGDGKFADLDGIAITHRVKGKSLDQFGVVTGFYKPQESIDHCLGTVDRHPVSRLGPEPVGMKGGEQVETMVGVLMRDDDCIDHVGFDREGCEGPRSCVTPDAGRILLDQERRGGPAWRRIGSRRPDNCETHLVECKC